ncbi:MAG: VWA domain-containing protein [Halieaceae bacterium]|nr:VWA domain-containing protein [Halieaceae bacterium]
MIELAHPLWLLLLPLPLLLRRLPAFKHRRDSVKVPFFQRLVDLSEEAPQTGAVVLVKTTLQKILLVFTWLCLVLAAAKPEWVGEPVEQSRSARDLMVAVDLSGSMQATDFATPEGEQINRLEAVKRVLTELAAERGGDRLGLIVFGSAPYLQAPFTEDHETWRTLLLETEIGMAGQSTVFGDAIGLAIHLFAKSDTENRVLMILTDGNDTGSKVPPVEAAKVARSRDIRIHTVAMGDPTSVGEEELDVETLKRVAELTGGAYFQAMDREQLQRAYAAIAALEPEEYESISFRPRHSLHHIPVALVMLYYGIYHVLAGWAASRREAQHVA